MKIIRLLLIAILAISAMQFISGQSTDSLPEYKSSKESETIYICSMHPEIVANKPGYCPKCGMQLVEKSKLSDSKHTGMHSMMMSGMDGSSHKKKFPMMLVMGAMMVIMAVVLMAGHNR